MQAKPAGEDGRGILSTVAVSLVLLTVVAGVIGFTFMQRRVEQLTSDSLRRLHGDRARVFTKVILESTLAARAVAERAGAMAEFRKPDSAREDAAARQQLFEATRSYLSAGFSWIAFYRDGRLRSEAGAPAPSPELKITLRGPAGRELLWSYGFYLRMRVPVRDGEREAGEVVIERPLDLLTVLSADVNQWGETGELLLCAAEGETLRCFPGRFLPQPFSIPLRFGDQPSIAARALKGEAGVVSAPDFRGQPVLAAHGPVGNYGLGMVVKMDAAELYAPIRRQLAVMLLVLALLAAVSLWLVHGRVAPVLRERKIAEEKFRVLAQTDMLTGLPNRTLFFDRVRQAMARTRRAGKPMALFFLDIDRFKQINDTFGHAAGDEVLRAFARRLRGCVRETDTVARLAGDEFTMILEGLGGAQDAETVARKVLESVRPPLVLADREVTIGSSIGIVLYAKEDGREMTADALLELADKALYSAKSGGRNRYVFHHELK
jgi:diguanylate cyclase (GGDEF)-like protein